MKFSQHVDSIVLKAKRTLGQINAAFRNRDPKFRLGLYLTFVRPILEYASPAWSPYLEKDVIKLENYKISRWHESFELQEEARFPESRFIRAAKGEARSHFRLQDPNGSCRYSFIELLY